MKYKIIYDIGTLNGFNWKNHIHFAQWIVKRKNPEVVVDLGVDYGYSTFCFALSKIGHVYGIDSFEGDGHAGIRNNYEYVLEKQKELELDNITFIKGYFDQVSKTWDKPIDILHIDGFHTYEAVKNDYEIWSKFVKDDGVILFHDTCSEDPTFGVKKFFDEIPLPKFNFSFSNGLGIVSKDQNIIDEIKNDFRSSKLMNYKIYQVFYDENQKQFLNTEFTPFDNTSNKKPNLLEYYIFLIGYKQSISENLSHWGFFSWKWEKKCKIKPQQFIDFIEENPNQDVYIINWAPYIESISKNIWDHGEQYHPGLTYIFNKIFKKMRFNDDYMSDNLIMDKKTFCFSSYFVASKRFWKDYLTFLKQVKSTIDNDIELKRLVYKKTSHNDQESYSFFPFLIERLFSTFLVMYGGYSKLNYPYDFSIYQKYIGDNYKELEKCSELKVKMFKYYKEGNVDMLSKYLKEWQLQTHKVNEPITIPDYDLKWK